MSGARVRTLQGAFGRCLVGPLVFGGVAVASVVAGSLPGPAATPVSLYAAVGAMGDLTSSTPILRITLGHGAMLEPSTCRVTNLA